VAGDGGNRRRIGDCPVQRGPAPEKHGRIKESAAGGFKGKVASRRRAVPGRHSLAILLSRFRPGETEGGQDGEEAQDDDGEFHAKQWIVAVISPRRAQLRTWAEVS
jgi:hypothetical protein